MKKILTVVLAFVMLSALAVPAMAARNETVTAEIKHITDGSNGGNSQIITVTVRDENGDIVATIDYPTDNSNATYEIPVDGYVVKVVVKGNKIDSAIITVYPEIEPEIVINLGFIGYYLSDGEVLNTSFYWQELNEGDMIDWDAVDAAYDAWVAQGGLAPARVLWQTSGYASFTFDDYDKIGYDDFGVGQLEGYYETYYVDPGYILPVAPPVVINKGCENCEGNNPPYLCDGSGCAGNGKGPAGGNQN